MNLDQIRLFVLVYKARSFTCVAKELNISPSSVSRSIAALEDQLKARLFQRTTRALTPTQLGEHYFLRVEALVDELDLANQEILNQNSEPFGTIRVTASTSFGQAVLAPLLTGFNDAYPRVNIDLVLMDTQTNVVEDQFDIAIRHGRLRDSNLIAKKLLDVRYHVVASQHYLETNTKITKPSHILNHKVISFGYKSFNKEWNFRKGKNTETIAIKPILTITTATAIKECVKNHSGIALLPDWIVSDELQKNTLVNIFPEWQAAGTEFDTSIWLIYPSRSYIPAKTRVFMDYLFTHTR